MKNLGLKLLSLLIAVTLVYFVQSQGNGSQVGFLVPIELKNIPEGKVLVRPIRSQASVTVRGPSFLVSQIPISPPRLAVTFPADVGAKYVARLSTIPLELPPAVDVVSIEPSEIEFSFDTVLTKMLPIEVPQIGRLPAGMILQGVTVQPTEVQVRGPESVVRALTRVESAPIDLREISGDVKKSVQLRTAPEQVEYSVSVVEAEIRAALKPVERLMGPLPVEIRAVRSRRVLVEPAQVRVQVQGPLEIVKELEMAKVLPFVRLNESAKDRDEVEVFVDVPAGLQVLAVTPPKVRLREKSK